MSGNGSGNGRHYPAAGAAGAAATLPEWRQERQEGAAVPRQEELPAATPATLPLPDAARLLGMSERTLRDRVQKGKVPAIRTDQGYRLATAVVEELRQRGDLAANLGNPGGSSGTLGTGNAGQPAAGPAADPAGLAALAALLAAIGNERQEDAATLAALRAENEGLRAQLAARETERTEAQEQAAEVGARNAALEAERGHLAGEVDFLRGQLESSRTAEEQLRVLLLRTSEQLSALQARIPALPEPKPRRPWWRRWERR
jgi:hypothetical protein